MFYKCTRSTTIVNQNTILFLYYKMGYDCVYITTVVKKNYICKFCYHTCFGLGKLFILYFQICYYTLYSCLLATDVVDPHSTHRIMDIHLTLPLYILVIMVQPIIPTFQVFILDITAHSIIPICILPKIDGILPLRIINRTVKYILNEFKTNKSCITSVYRKPDFYT